MGQLERAIIKEYRESKQDYLTLESVVHNKITGEIGRRKIRCLAIHHRVKKKSSLSNKVREHSGTYKCLNDVTDILGFRVITFFSDDVDLIGKLMEDMFVVDWENSVDKRKLIQATAFGYLSLHYICSLKETDGFPPELTNKKFEVQIRTGLQHIWAEIEHDIGYKNKFGVPREIRREFSKIAGLLEIADDEFVQVRKGMNQYVTDIREKIIHDEAKELPLNEITLTEYMHNNKKMLAYLELLADIEDTELMIVTPDFDMERLKWLSVETLGDMESVLDRNKELAYKIAKEAIAGKEAETFLSTTGLGYLCKAELLNRNASKEQMVEFFRLTEKRADKAERLAKILYQHAKLKKENPA